MMKKSNKNYTNFDSYEFAEIIQYPYLLSLSGIRIRYPLPAFSTMPSCLCEMAGIGIVNSQFEHAQAELSNQGPGFFVVNIVATPAFRK